MELGKGPKDTLLPQRKNAEGPRDVEMVPPDGGWGWMVLLGSFIGFFLGNFSVVSYGIIFYPILKSGGTSSAEIAWIINFGSLIWSFYTLLVGPLSEAFGHRKVAILGGLASFLSFFLSSYVQNPGYLFITFAVPFGISGGTAVDLSLMVVAKYFRKRKGFAIGITTIGGCLSQFAAPVVSNYLLENFGYKGACLIFSAICLNQCVGGALFQPVEWHLKPVVTSSNDYSNDGTKITIDDQELKRKNDEIESRNLKDDSELLLETTSNLKGHKANEDLLKCRKPKNPKSRFKFRKVLKSTYNNLKSLKHTRVQIIAWSYTGLIIGNINFMLWIPFVLTNLGYSLELGAWCSSAASIGNITGRFGMTFLSDRKFFNVIYGYMSGLFLMGSATLAFSLVNDINVLVTLSCFWGLGSGVGTSLFAPVMIKVMGPQMLPAVFGVSSLFKGVVGIVIGILIGVVRDATQSYKYTLWMLGGFHLLIFCMLFLMPCGEKFDKLKYSKSDEKSKA